MKAFILVLLLFIYLTQQGCTKYPLTKVFKQNKSNYSLSNSNTWKQYPQLKVTLQLSEPILASINYVITIGSSGDSHLVTRIIVDSEQYQYFRAISGNNEYHTNSVSGYVPLMEGSHEIRVEYRTPGNFVVNSAADWVTAYLMVTY